jgi:hypothetical protein
MGLAPRAGPRQRPLASDDPREWTRVGPRAPAGPRSGSTRRTCWSSSPEGAYRDPTSSAGRDCSLAFGRGWISIRPPRGLLDQHGARCAGYSISMGPASRATRSAWRPRSLATRSAGGRIAGCSISMQSARAASTSKPDSCRKGSMHTHRGCATVGCRDMQPETAVVTKIRAARASRAAHLACGAAPPLSRPPPARLLPERPGPRSSPPRTP